MKIALPINDTLTIYKNNPHTAPRFAIYIIEHKANGVYFSLSSIVENPLSKYKSQMFDQEQKSCECSAEREKNIEHICEHYSLLETLSDCSYLLANKYCKNTKSSMMKAGVVLFKIPPIINQIDIAIKNFILGVPLANNIRYIHNAS